MNVYLFSYKHALCTVHDASIWSGYNFCCGAASINKKKKKKRTSTILYLIPRRHYLQIRIVF